VIHSFKAGTGGRIAYVTPAGRPLRSNQATNQPMPLPPGGTRPEHRTIREGGDPARVGPHATGSIYDPPCFTEDLMREERLRRQGTHERKKILGTIYAGLTTCLRCDDVFESWDRRQNRLCDACRQAIEEQPSEEPFQTIHEPRRRPQGSADL
jgi:hypothetical protein